jgi:hypothetical protein
MAATLLMFSIVALGVTNTLAARVGKRRGP